MIQLNNISKIYKHKNRGTDVIAVDQISLTIRQGSVVGLLGPNGAGKSTLIKMILGVLYPTTGEAVIRGLNTFNYRTKLMKHIGIVFGQRSQLWWDLPSVDSYELIRKMYDVNKMTFEKNLESMVEYFNVQDIVTKPVRYLSLGQRMKCEIIAALCFQPDIIILDEPTIGLDIEAKEAIRAFINKLNKEKNVTVLLATHDLADVEAICSRVIVMNRGKILFDDSNEEIKRRQNEKKEVNIVCNNFNSIMSIPFKCKVKDIGNKSIISLLDSGQEITKIINCFFKNCDVDDVTITRQSIEKVVLDLYKLQE